MIEKGLILTGSDAEEYRMPIARPGSGLRVSCPICEILEQVRRRTSRSSSFAISSHCRTTRKSIRSPIRSIDSLFIKTP